jgi:hypothetical protein
MGKPWFGAKTYGIGVGPKSPAGWTSVVVYCVLMLVTPTAMRSVGPHWAGLAAGGLITVGYLVLVALKSDGAPWRWRWGGK